MFHVEHSSRRARRQVSFAAEAFGQPLGGGFLFPREESAAENSAGGSHRGHSQVCCSNRRDRKFLKRAASRALARGEVGAQCSTWNTPSRASRQVRFAAEVFGQPLGSGFLFPTRRTRRREFGTRIGSRHSQV